MDDALEDFDWQAGGILGLDVGDVLSVKGGAQWDAPWKTADPGAVAFLVFFKVRYGAKFKVFSRVNNPRRSWINAAGKQCWHWVLNFIDSIGIPAMGIDWDDIHLVHTGLEKAALSKSHRLNAYVDNSFENLYHIGMQCPNCRLVMYNNNGFNTGEITFKARDRDLANFAEIADQIIVIRSWYELAMLCKLPVTHQLWDRVERASPPYHPWSSSLVNMVECQLNDGTQVPRQPPCRPPGVDTDSRPRPSSHGIYAVDAEGDAEPADQRPPWAMSSSSSSSSESVVVSDDDEPVDQSRPLASSSGSVFVGGSEPAPVPHGLTLTRAPFGNDRWSAAPCPQSGQGYAPPLVFPPVPPVPVPQAQDLKEAQSALLHTLVNSDRGGTITVTPDGTTSVTIESRERAAQPVTRWQLSGGKGNGQWMNNKRMRAWAYHRRLQDLAAQGESPPPPNNSFVMCTLCGRGQAGQDCIHQCCSPCCAASFEWCTQHVFE
jgi:hypothetical protein